MPKRIRNISLIQLLSEPRGKFSKSLVILKQCIALIEPSACYVSAM